MKVRIVLGMAAVAALMLAQTGLALPIEIGWDWGYCDDVGGEFTIFLTGYESNGYSSRAQRTDETQRVGFQTFCLETNEWVERFPDYYTIDPSADRGGADGGSPDPLSIGSVWLYDQFSRGVLEGYDYTRGNWDYTDEDPPFPYGTGTRGGISGSAHYLQLAFWYLEDEVDDIEPDTLQEDWLEAAVSAIGDVNDIPGLMRDATKEELSQYRIAVINPSLKGEPKQSMLVRVPDGGMTALLLGAGMLGCMALRRRLS